MNGEQDLKGRADAFFQLTSRMRALSHEFAFPFVVVNQVILSLMPLCMNPPNCAVLLHGFRCRM
jgi:hypothetical protein